MMVRNAESEGILDCTAKAETCLKFTEEELLEIDAVLTDGGCI